MLVIVHGGAATVTSALVQSKLADLRRSAKAGFVALLRHNESSKNAALDAVQCAVEVMEDSPYFNAGYGSSLTSAENVEMDSIIVDGERLDFGAISSVTEIKNPIKVARSILDNSEHCVFTANGAHRFAAEHGFALIDPDSMVHQYAKDRLAEFRTFNNAIRCDHKIQSDRNDQTDNDHDTVGSVAIDGAGNVAAATSTGGITGKQPGRVGDTPVIGSGAYADNGSGAVSTTGHGEAIMRVCLAREVLYRYERNRELECTDSANTKQSTNSLQDAVDQSLRMMADRVDGYGGLIAVGPRREIGIGFTTRGMPWAYITSDDVEIDQLRAQLTRNDSSAHSQIKIKIHYGYLPGEHFTVIE